MKFNKLYHLLEGVFEPASDDEVYDRKKVGNLMMLGKYGIKDLSRDDKITFNVPYSFLSKYPDLPEIMSGEVYTPNSRINGENHFQSYVEALMPDSDRYLTAFVSNKDILTVNGAPPNYVMDESVFKPASAEERALRRKELHPDALDFLPLNKGDKVIYHIPADGTYFKDPNESEGPYNAVATVPNYTVNNMSTGTEYWSSQVELIKPTGRISRVVLNRHLTPVVSEGVFDPASVEEISRRESNYIKNMLKQQYDINLDELNQNDLKKIETNDLQDILKVGPEFKEMIDQEFSERGKYYIADLKEGDKVWAEGIHSGIGKVVIPNEDMDYQYKRWFSNILLDSDMYIHPETYYNNKIRKLN